MHNDFSTDTSLDTTFEYAIPGYDYTIPDYYVNPLSSMQDAFVEVSRLYFSNEDFASSGLIMKQPIQQIIPEEHFHVDPNLPLL